MALKAPPAKDYETGLRYWPYKKTLDKTLEIIRQGVPFGGTVADLMCGPGYLLGQIATRRADLLLRGVDLDRGNIDLAREKYPGIAFEMGDILAWQPKEQFDCVVCTGAMHHLPYERQEDLMKIMLDSTKSGGFGIISDCYVDDFKSERERQIAAAKMGYEYLLATIKNDAPSETIEDTADILRQDVMMLEFKDSLRRRRPKFERVFGKRNFHTEKIWPKKGICRGYGDYITVYRKK